MGYFLYLALTKKNKPADSLMSKFVENDFSRKNSIVNNSIFFSFLYRVRTNCKDFYVPFQQSTTTTTSKVINKERESLTLLNS